MNKTALITGANKGIGLAIARELGTRGLHILLGARSEERGEEAVKRLRAENLSVEFVKIDLNNFDSLYTTVADLPLLDLLINNAGIPDSPKPGRADLDNSKSVYDYTTEDLRATMEVNFFGTHELIAAVLAAGKLAADGKIINLTVPIQPNAFWHPLAYMTSKAALNTMSMIYAHEFETSKSQRQIFGILPGAIATDLNGAKAGSMGGFVKTPEDAGKLVAKYALATDNHSGQIIQFDGRILTDYEAQLNGLTNKIAKSKLASNLTKSFAKSKGQPK